MSVLSIPVEGDIIADKFRVERILGQGGMGVVVAATHLQLDQRVAIKFLLPEATEHPEIVERFAREARAAARMQGQNVVRVIDVGALDDGRTFMVMEYLEGSDLEHVLEKHGALQLQEALGYLGEALEALAEAHAKGIVHRDLKPGNLFLANQPDGGVVVKVLDFGISKLQDDRAALTRTSTAMGTAFYMSPEQLSNAKDVDERADIWSLGVILHELVSNQRPFDGTSMPEIVAKILRNQRTPLTELGLPAEFDAVVARCLKGERDDRYADVGELAQALAPFGPPEFDADRVVRVRGRAPAPARVALSVRPERAPDSALSHGATQLAISTSGELPPEVAKPKGNSWLAVAAVALLVLGSGSAWWWKSRELRAEAEAPQATTASDDAARTAGSSLAASAPAAEASAPVIEAAAASAAPSATPSALPSAVAPPASNAATATVRGKGGSGKAGNKNQPTNADNGQASPGQPKHGYFEGLK